MNSSKFKVVTSSAKGRSLVAAASIQESEVILEESPLVSAQFSYNKAYGYLACEHCMLPLETAEQNVRRLAFNPAVVLPYPEADASLKTSIVECADTKFKFCSESCMAEAEKKYHKLVGPHLMPGQALDYVNEIWKKFHYPPETATILLVLRMFALVKNFPEMAAQFSEFCDRPISDDEQLCHKMLGDKFREQLSEIQNALVNVFAGDQELEKFLTCEGLIRLFAMIGTNQQGIGTSSFAVWVKNIGEMDLNTAQRQEVDQLIDTLYTTFDDTVGTQFLNNEGSGLYLTQSKINHSCSPNAEIRFPYNNHVIQVVALRAIGENEEICISYLDECQLDRSRYSRQKHLRENYLFLCDCEKCKAEADQPDMTSEEEDDEDDDEMDDD